MTANCHKSLAHLLMMNDVVQAVAEADARCMGILGGVPKREFTRDSREGEGAAAMGRVAGAHGDRRHFHLRRPAV
ncbi:hypothetical protein ACNKHQ_01095 [Shigella flexneri]